MSVEYTKQNKSLKERLKMAGTDPAYGTYLALKSLQIIKLGLLI